MLVAKSPRTIGGSSRLSERSCMALKTLNLTSPKTFSASAFLTQSEKALERGCPSFFRKP